MHGKKEFTMFFWCIKSLYVKGNYFERGFIVFRCCRYHGNFIRIHFMVRCGLWQEVWGGKDFDLGKGER